VSVEIFEEDFERAPGFVGVKLCGWSEDAVFGVVRDFGDGFGGGVGGCGLGEVEAGDLQAVEEKPGATRIDLVGGDAAEDFADGLLDSGAVFRVGKGEAGLAALAGGCVLDWAARAVMEVAEGLARRLGAFGAAEGWAAAAAAVGEDVAALEASGFGLCCDDFRCHVFGDLPSPLFLRKFLE
jgi:hypothetical protein